MLDLYQYGLWNEDMTMYNRIDPSSLISAALSQNGGSSCMESIRCVSLDNMIKSGELQLPQLDVIKMDIEGAEVLALKGMVQTINQFRPKILLELNRPALKLLGSTVADIWEFLSNISYKIEAFYSVGGKGPCTRGKPGRAETFVSI